MSERFVVSPFLLFLLLLPLSSCSLIFGSSEDSGKSAAVRNRKRPTLILSRFVRISENELGRREWILKAREARFFKKTHLMFLTDFIITFFENGTPSSHLRARRGIINTMTKDITALRKVFLKSNNGRTLHTEELYGNMRSKIISNAVFNRITTEDDTIITGTHLHGRNDLKIFKLKNAVGSTSQTSLSNKDGSGKSGSTGKRGTTATNG